MAVVINPTTRSSVSLTPSSSSSTNLVINKGGGTLQSLSNVSAANPQDGYTLVYDTETNKWVAQSVSSAVASVDGGTY